MNIPAGYMELTHHACNVMFLHDFYSNKKAHIFRVHIHRCNMQWGKLSIVANCSLWITFIPKYFSRYRDVWTEMSVGASAALQFSPDFLPKNLGPRLGEENEQYYDSCLDSASGKSGSCMPALSCPSFLTALTKRRNQRRPEVCYFEGNNPWICCIDVESKGMNQQFWH